MDSRRRGYLRALEIDVWERRSLSRELTAVEVPQTAASTVAEQPAEAPAPSRFAGRLPPPIAADHSSGPVEAIGATSPVKLADPANVADIAAVAGYDWPELEAAVKGCTRCPLHSTRTQGVFGVGNRQARWMIVGEAPGADEDRQGEPFVGRAGQLLNSMLRAIGLQREEVFIANILKSRPPNNRDPKPEEVQACIPYLFRQIELVNPTLILCVGRIAAQTLLGTTVTIGKLRGQVHRLASGRPMIVTYHPAYLLRSPVEKRKSWADLVLAMQTFERLS
jgi:uracil-DNA glycosylase family 4